MIDLDYDDSGWRTREYGDYIAQATDPYGLWHIERADGKPVPAALEGSFTSLPLIEQMIERQQHLDQKAKQDSTPKVPKAKNVIKAE